MQRSDGQKVKIRHLVLEFERLCAAFERTESQKLDILPKRSNAPVERSNGQSKNPIFSRSVRTPELGFERQDQFQTVMNPFILKLHNHNHSMLSPSTT